VQLGETLENLNNRVEAFPIALGLSATSIDHEIGDFRVKVAY
jgi:hypothetical protein